MRLRNPHIYLLSISLSFSRISVCLTCSDGDDAVRDEVVKAKVVEADPPDQKRQQQDNDDHRHFNIAEMKVE